MGFSYDQNIVLDLEFTPLAADEVRSGLAAEVIEIGAVRTDESGNVLDTFEVRVCPQIASGIARVVTRLTDITWWDVAEQLPFAEQLAALCAWIGSSKRSRIVAWSPADRQQLEAECSAKGIEMPAELARWLDLQQVYPRLMRVGRSDRRMSLADAIAWSGVQVDARRQHGALYDAMCTAGLLRMVKTDESVQQLRAYEEHMPQRRGENGTPLTSNPMADALKGFFD